MQFFTSFRNKAVLATVLMIALVLFASWSMPPSGNMFTELFYVKDTIPRNDDKKIAELDKALAGLEKTKEKLREKDIEKVVGQALKDIDVRQVREDIDKAKGNAALILQDINTEMVQRQIEAAISRIDIEKITARVKLAVADLQPQIEQSLKEARIQIEKAQDELKKIKYELRSRDI